MTGTLLMGVPSPMRSQLVAREVWLSRDERDAVEWRRAQRARNEAPSEVVALLAVSQSSRCAEAPRDWLAGATSVTIGPEDTFFFSVFRLFGSRDAGTSRPGQE